MNVYTARAEGVDGHFLIHSEGRPAPEADDVENAVHTFFYDGYVDDESFPLKVHAYDDGERVGTYEVNMVHRPSFEANRIDEDDA